jgi:predicted MFS family arabinose efflux permease
LTERFGTASRRDLGLVVAAVGLSAAGDWIAATALVLHVQDMTDSALAVSALLIAVWGPLVFFSAPAGALVDRLENVRMLAVVSLVQAALAVALGLTLDPLGVVLALTLALGVGAAITQPVEFALVPVVAGGRELVKANGYVETARYAGIGLGPVVGGALAAAGGTELALIIDAATFVAVAAFAVMMKARRRAHPAQEHDARADGAGAGFVFLWRDRLLALVMAVTVASLALFTICATAEVFFIKEDLAAGDFGFGVAWSTWTVGMAIGATVLARRFGPGAMAAGAFGMIVVQGLGIASGPVSVLYSAMLIGYAIGGVAHGTKAVLVRTLVHERTPDRLHGRTFAAYNGLRNVAEIGALALGGVLVAVIGARGALFIAGFGPALVGAIALAVYARVMPPAHTARAAQAEVE